MRGSEFAGGSGLRNELLDLAEVRRLLSNPLCDRKFIESLRDDPRPTVATLLLEAERRSQRLEEERERHEEMLAIERELQATGRFVIAGVGQAGIGPLAGPIVAAAVVLGDAVGKLRLDDPKRLDAARRAELSREIRDAARFISIGISDVDEINELNVYHAGLLAMRRAVEDLPERPDHALVDASRIPDIGIEQSAYVRGDARSLSIAAASIVAKVHRDAIMDELDVLHPGYGFCRHRGYNTPEHQAALRRLGPSPVHRSFDTVRELIANGRDLHD